MTQRIIDFPDGYTNVTAPTFGDGLGDGSLEPFQEVPVGVVNGVNATFALTYTPSAEAACWVYVDGVLRNKDTQWNLSGSSIVFVAGNIPVTAQDVYVVYLKAAPGGGGGASSTVEYRTITGGEITAKQITLAQTPLAPTEVIVLFLGGTYQLPTTDFTVTGTTLDWNGLGLDGYLIAGDKLLVSYGY